jgi:hypothetical protein
MEIIKKPIVGYEGIYFITSGGDVINNLGLKKKTSVINSGYEMTWLSKNNKSKGRTVHRLVAEAFITNPDNLPQVNHKDGNKLNNCVENLEWTSRSQNMKHLFRIGLGEGTRLKARERMKMIGKAYAQKNGDHLRKLSKKTSKPVYQLDMDGNIINRFDSINEANRVTGATGIHYVLNGKYSQAGGFKWKSA